MALPRDLLELLTRLGTCYIATVARLPGSTFLVQRPPQPKLIEDLRQRLARVGFPAGEVRGLEDEPGEGPQRRVRRQVHRQFRRAIFRDAAPNRPPAGCAG